MEQKKTSINIDNQSLTKGKMKFIEEWVIFLINVAGEIEHPYTKKENELKSISCILLKN